MQPTMQAAQPPKVKPGEKLEAWLQRAVPALVAGFGKSQDTATQLATQAWMQVNQSQPVPSESGWGEDDTNFGDDSTDDFGSFGKSMWSDEEEQGFEWDDPQEEWGQPVADIANGEDPEIDSTINGNPAEWYQKRLGEYARLLSAQMTDAEEISEGQRTMIDAAAEMLIELLGEQVEKLKNKPADANDASMEKKTPKPEPKQPQVEMDAEADPTAEGDAPAEDGTQSDNPFAEKKKKPNPFASSKAATLISLFESEIHMNFTNLADSLRRDGHLTRKERIAFSNAIGDALGAFVKAAEENMPEGTLYRSPWADVGKDEPQAGNEMPVAINPDPAATKGGDGSGFFGHAGRPGQRGGSAPDGSERSDKVSDHVRNSHILGKKYPYGGNEGATGWAYDGAGGAIENLLGRNGFDDVLGRDRLDTASRNELISDIASIADFARSGDAYGATDRVKDALYRAARFPFDASDEWKNGTSESVESSLDAGWSHIAARATIDRIMDVDGVEGILPQKESLRRELVNSLAESFRHARRIEKGDEPADKAASGWMGDEEEDATEGEAPDAEVDAMVGDEAEDATEGEPDDVADDMTAEGEGKKPAAKALGGPVSEMDGAVKSLGKNRIGGYLMMWGNAQSRDLEGEYFTPKTEEMTVIFDSMKALPVIWHHAQDGVMKATVIGVIDTMKPDEIGMWVEAQIKNGKAYRQYVQPLLKQGMLGWSSGALPGSKKAFGGEIKRWATVEGSLTPTPMDHRQVEVPIDEIKGYFIDAGLQWDDGLIA